MNEKSCPPCNRNCKQGDECPNFKQTKLNWKLIWFVVIVYAALAAFVFLVVKK